MPAASCLAGGNSEAVQSQLSGVQQIGATGYAFGAILADGRDAGQHSLEQLFGSIEVHYIRWGNHRLSGGRWEEPRSYGYPYSLLNVEPRSYESIEFPNHVILVLQRKIAWLKLDGVHSLNIESPVIWFPCPTRWWPGALRRMAVTVRTWLAREGDPKRLRWGPNPGVKSIWHRIPNKNDSEF